MARPKLDKKIKTPPPMEGFKPFGVPITDLEPVILLFEEYEALRLSDYEGLEQEAAAKQMNISRPTYTRIINKARKSIARAFIECKAIFIEGGNYITDDNWYRCEKCMKLIISKTKKKKCNYCKSPVLRKLNN
jgi:uncharacterized protein